MPETAERHPDEPVFVVVVNHEEQHSVWPAGREVPAGWRETGVRGTRAECLAHIAQVWTDLRPLSVRR
ncbi:MbtH family protein [Dactylosporangium sp. NPDC051485]|uniref:MbtH family protein n=1 Tax=Dactylosporangium sp. NPDC051485 TaxID=3154846 RepID=UPI0034425601